MKKVSVENNINKYYVVIGSLCLIAVIILLIFTITKNAKQYLVQIGTLEYTEITTGYIVKKEKTIDKEQSKVLVPVATEGSRVSKNDIIATYKGEEYKNYEESLSKMDKEILDRMKDLPTVYSSEVDTIENTIHALVKESIGETSYSKLQEYKQKINSNINKRANIIGELSPAGAEIKKLIEKRNKYELEAKKSNDNILASMPGIVSYTADGLEDELSYTDAKKLDYTSIKQTIDSEKQVNNTKIKIVNNYEAYIVLKASLKNAEHIAQGYNYRLRLIEQDNYEFLGMLDRIKQVEDGIEVYFKVTNGIEYLVNLREAEIEIVWDYSKGFIVPPDALNKYENKSAQYVTAIKQGEYKNIPVNIKTKNENYIVVDNYSAEELETLELESEYKLQLYDRIIIGSKK